MTTSDFLDMPRFRQPEVHNRANLSVQASSSHYCTPRSNACEDIDGYISVEVGLIHPKTGELCRPTDMLNPFTRHIPITRRAKEARTLDGLFESGSSPVAGYVSQDNLNRLREWLA